MKEYIVKVKGDRTEWYNLEGQLHREDGPAFEWPDGSKEWYINGKLHREDGPAIEDTNGTKKWWLNGEKLTEKKFNKMIKKINDTTNSCNDKIVEIDGKKYKLTEI